MFGAASARESMDRKAALVGEGAEVCAFVGVERLPSTRITPGW